MNEIKHEPPPGPPDRRGFLQRLLAIVLGGLAIVPPLAAGLTVLLHPLRRRSAQSRSVSVAPLAALPEDGTPRKFPVVMDHVDAWNKVPSVPVGAVYLRRQGQDKVQALNVVCPHAGCFVNYEPGRNGYFCPCHNSIFALDGSIRDRRSPSPRAMDELEVEIRNGSEVWVKFQNFQAGVAKKIPVA